MEERWGCPVANAFRFSNLLPLIPSSLPVPSMENRFKVFGSGRGRRKRRRLLIERLTDRRVLAAITGVVFEDAGVQYRQESVEAGLAQRLVYLDANDNGQLDPGEPLTRTSEDGSFSFASLSEGQHIVRLFDGTSTQSPTFPLQASTSGSAIPLTDPLQTLASGSASWTLTPGSIVVADLETGQSNSLTVGEGLKRMAALPDGKLLVIGGDVDGSDAWLVDLLLLEATPIALADSEPGFTWTDLALDADGHGLLIRQSVEGSHLYRLDASAVDADSGHASLDVTATGLELPPGARVLSSGSGHRSVIAWPGDEGLDLTLWSNPTATAIINPPISVTGAAELLAFDDASGLLITRTAAGGVSVLDVDAGFAALHDFVDLAGPVALDGPREILVAASTATESIRLIDLRDGSSLADLPFDLATVGEVTALLTRGAAEGLILVGSSGLRRVTLGPSLEHRILIVDGQSPPPIRFGLQVTGENAPPVFQTLPSFIAREGVTLELSAPAALAGAFDADGDGFVLVQAGPAAHGTATFSTSGAVVYIPAPGFHGTDSVPVLLHDGRDGTSANLEIVVTPAPDPITGVSPDSASVPENVVGDVIAELVVEGRDEEAFYIITTNDDRFVVEFGALRLAEGVWLDYEQEQQVVIGLTVTDPIHGDTFSQPFTVFVIDVPEWPQSLGLTGDSVVELRPGDEVGQVIVDGIVPTAGVNLAVDDSRFEIVSGTLKLTDGVWVERAGQSEIQLEISAQDAGQFFAPLTATFVIQVLANDTPFHNESYPFDVDGDGAVTSFDALLIINYLNTYGPGPVGFGDPAYGYDVNGDGLVTALDALLVINEINRLQNNGGTVSGEGEAAEQEPQHEPGPPAPPVDMPRLRLLAADDDERQDEALRTLDPPSPRQPLADSNAAVRLLAACSPARSPAATATNDAGDATDKRETFASTVDRTMRLLSSDV